MIAARSLLDRERWTRPARWAGGLIAEISGGEAWAIANDTAIQRAVEAFLFERHAEHPATRSLLMFVLDAQEVSSFIELVIDGRGDFVWDLAHAASPEAPGTRDFDGLARRSRRPPTDDSN